MARSAAEKREFKAKMEAERLYKEQEEEKKQTNQKTMRIVVVSFLIMIVGFACYFAAHLYNPDPDAYWLIETGRYIVENGKVPKTNPWTYTEGLSIIVQSPLCAVLNYLWYSFSTGIDSMWQLAMVENFILVFATIALSYRFSKDRTTAFLSAILVEVFFTTYGLITTRPYQLTTAVMMFLIMNLEKAKQKDTMGGVFASVALVTVFQANFQMANLIMIACFISCYAFGNGIDRLRQKQRLRNERIIAWIFVYIEWFVFSLINPYGVNGFLYLFKSSEAMRMISGRIYEMQPPTTKTLVFIVMAVTLFFFFYMAVKRKKWNMTEGFLVIGSFIATCLASRNFWMVVIAFVIMYTRMVNEKEKNPDSYWNVKMRELRHRIVADLPQSAFKLRSFLLEPSKRKINFSSSVHKLFRGGMTIAACLISTCMFLLSFNAAKNSTKDVEDLLSFIQEEIPETSKVYTSFNTGGYLEFLGRKIYIDARPELYSKNITKSETDILQDWINLEWKNTESIPEYIETSDWDYYFVAKETPIYYCLEYGKAAECVFKNDTCAIYKCL